MFANARRAAQGSPAVGRIAVPRDTTPGKMLLAALGLVSVPKFPAGHHHPNTTPLWAVPAAFLCGLQPPYRVHWRMPGGWEHAVIEPLLTGHRPRAASDRGLTATSFSSHSSDELVTKLDRGI